MSATLKYMIYEYEFWIFNKSLFYQHWFDGS